VTFDQNKITTPSGTAVTFEYKKGVGIMRVVSSRATPRAILDPMTSTDGWTAAGSASGLTLDNTVFYQYPASLRFTLTGASVGTLTKAPSQQNLSTYEDVGVAFLAIYAPDVTNLTSIALRIGSSASAYDEVSTTTGFLGAWTSGDYVVVAFDMARSTSTGTPSWSAIDYIQVRVTHGATITNFRVGGLWISLPSPHEVLYQSNAIFKASGANPSTTIVDDNDQIILNDSAYLIFEIEAAKAVATQDANTDKGQISKFTSILDDPNNGLYMLYRADNPSQELRQVGNYYYD
jgi:hypothetical protein